MSWQCARAAITPSGIEAGPAIAEEIKIPAASGRGISTVMLDPVTGTGHACSSIQ
ncbi:MAG: hypothetical protein IIB73_09750 [Proteobacteria bacterium]|nr:hypothetical protein [Pseudomonadota bacterium]